MMDRGAKLSEGDYNHATDPEYKQLRDEADKLYQKRSELSRQSQIAYKQGDKSRAKELSDQSKKVLDQAEDKNFEAANYVFKQNNLDSASDEIDLHGLYVKEAEAILRRRIDLASKNGEDHLRVIVGKGLHSKNGIAKIKPAVDQLCDDSRLKHYIDPKNTGVLVIELDKNSHVSAPQAAHGSGNQSHGQNQSHGNNNYQGTQQPQYHQQQPSQQGQNNNNDDIWVKIGSFLCTSICNALK